MLYAFTDESYSYRRYFQAAYIVDEIQLPKIEEAHGELLRYLEALGVRGNFEFHGHAIMNAKDSWKALKGRLDLKIKIFRFFVEQVKAIDGALLIEGLEVMSFDGNQGNSSSPHLESSKNLLRAIDRFAEKHGRDIYIYSDKVSKEERRRIRFDTLNHNNLYPRIKSVNFVESSDFPGIQIADMCIYLYRRLVDHQEVNRRTMHLVEELWESLAPLVDRDVGL